MPTNFELITRERAAEILHVSLRSIDNMVDTGQMPPPRSLIPNSRRRYWLPELFYGWLRERLGGAAVDAQQSTPGLVDRHEDQPAPAPDRNIVPRTGRKKRPTKLPTAEVARARQDARLAALNTPRSTT